MLLKINIFILIRCESISDEGFTNLMLSLEEKFTLRNIYLNFSW